MSDGIASLTRFDRNGAGDCLEASFDADPQAVTIRARDIVQLQARTNAGAWESVYKGFATIVGSERAYGMRTCKLVGLKQRFYEIVLTARSIAGADVTSMVDDALSGVTLPEGVTYSSSDVPELAFEMGTRYPQLETLGDFLDALAESVGAFIVPAGQTYAYDAVTYSAGDTVPAVQWGVDADGRFFFRRPQSTPAEAREGAAGTMVRWEDIAAEEAVDHVTLVYANERPVRYLSENPIDGPGTNPPPTPIYRTFGSGDYNAARAITLDPPNDFMVSNPGTVQMRSGSMNDLTNITDGDTGTYAEFTSAGIVTIDGPSGVGQWIAHIRLEPSDLDQVLRFQMYRWNGGSVEIFGVYTPGRAGDLVNESGFITLALPQLDGHENDTTGIFVPGSVGDRVYEVSMYVPDEDASELLAEAYMRSPNANASSVEVIGRLAEVAARMRLTPIGEAPVEVPVERVETRLTNEDGLVSTYFLAQAFDAEELSERAVLKALARRAARR